jgi:hypothetical protein
MGLQSQWDRRNTIPSSAFHIIEVLTEFVKLTKFPFIRVPQHQLPIQNTSVLHPRIPSESQSFSNESSVRPLTQGVLRHNSRPVLCQIFPAFAKDLDLFIQRFGKIDVYLHPMSIVLSFHVTGLSAPIDKFVTRLETSVTFQVIRNDERKSNFRTNFVIGVKDRCRCGGKVTSTSIRDTISMIRTFPTHSRGASRFGWMYTLSEWGLSGIVSVLCGQAILRAMENISRSARNLRRENL